MPVLYRVSCRPQAKDKEDKIVQERIDEAYTALDTLLEAMGRLPINQITTRPPLHQAYIRGLKVIDEAVKEGRYVVPSS